MTAFETAPAPGYVVLAAYQPPEALFTRQLRSIQEQTLSDFHCVIVADGGADDVRAMVRQAIGDDDRFDVVGFDERVGFYANFERGLAEVPVDAPWVALSDQDDEWMPDKLAVLVSALDRAALVSGQARVVTYPEGVVVAATTHRRSVSAPALVLENQFSGALCVFRGSLLKTALPFPRYPGPAQVHDHWLAVCAAVTGGIDVVDRVVQDYVQHSSNVLGEADAARLGWRQTLRRRRDALRAETGTRGLRAVARSVYVVNAGWAEAMVDMLAARVDEERAQRLAAAFGGHRRAGRTLRTVAAAVRRGEISPRTAAVYLVGGAAWNLTGGRRSER
ncbi:glycosyltransferase involved in cell wall biosynthesis [Microbacterium testaceum]|uniref:glycosyltransferase n=1 Tax=Microbacterium TaxID=33882 RepID=UPI00277EF633|nr:MULTISPECIES: glycosyltransferase [Microbacterium]MDQ1112993.1 glycosyltransferase involved in cell wall biosynthesis [Microbacterium testaceum]MDR6096468.1 glycosyltransferase involved in cell wall biosynthesis [Microbacterium sp. SORGH_AS_0454]